MTHVKQALSYIVGQITDYIDYLTYYYLLKNLLKNATYRIEKGIDRNILIVTKNNGHVVEIAIDEQTEYILKKLI